ncbi:MAG: TIGR00725 family protein [candidate division WOR-3 bacterium]|nr:MAG: TIGR00725 family protein [candidate division WOR-3 bacterium]
MRRKIIAVIGGSEASDKHLKIAEEVGSLIAERGAILITGGMGGIMSAASKGAKESNGLVIGVLPTVDRESANPYVDIPIVTGLSNARNFIIARTCDCAVAIDGKYGTLSEIAYCLMYDVPVIGIDTWTIEAPIIPAENAREAVDAAFSRISK